MRSIRQCLPLLLLPLLLTTPVFAESLIGTLTVQWGDPHPDLDDPTVRRIMLTDDAGQHTELTMSDELFRGGIFRWNGRRVEVLPPAGAAPREPGEAMRVGALRLIGEESLGGTVSGSQPWISILCKFADVATEPENLAFFQNMYANTPGELDHYWREVSYDHIDIVGSTAIDWVDLPDNHTDYVPTPGSNSDADLNTLFDDCTAAADPFVDFANGGTPFAGINMMFNDLLDCCAWGGSRFATLDGVTKSWRTTWEPPWGYANAGVIAHEMGHGFGLPHANNWDADGNPYDSPWDVMSAATSNSVFDSVYGSLGKHVNAYHKERLGWFEPARQFTVTDEGSFPITLDHTALANSSNYQIATIPIGDGSTWYTVEARQRTGEYEANLPGDAVIIHEVNPNRSEPSWAVDGASPPADFGSNEGTMWKVGETFEDTANQISVRVDSETANGFRVTLISGNPSEIFFDGFESGDTTVWSSAQP